ncbi:MAG: glycosyltransferase family 4 protein [Bryobacterales bacterium]|nr:glycosyltransferase family 4 protein [Bryobacterales bacterium]
MQPLTGENKLGHGTFLDVLGLHPRRIGGVEVRIKELTRRLAERGWRSVICVSDEPSPEVRRFLDSPFLQWEVIPNFYNNDLSMLPTLARLLVRHRPQWMMIEFLPCLSAYPWLARILGVEKIFFTDHCSRSMVEETRASGIKRMLGRFATSPYNAVVTVSDHNYRALASRGFVSGDRLHRVYNGVDLQRMGTEDGASFRRRFAIPQDRVLVVQTASLIQEKGTEDLLLGARLALQQNPNLHFAFVGDGPQGALAHFKGISGELGIDSHVTFTGLINDPAADGVYASADICCLLSRWQEAFGLVIAEAMASQRPVIGTRVGAIPEIVEDGRTGFLTPPGDHAMLANRILELAADPQLRRQMGSLGRDKVERMFTLDMNVRALIQLFESS